MQSTNKTNYAAVPFLIFGIILITAFFLKYFEPMPPVVLRNWAEHLSIALIVAVVIGLTYEYTSHLFREEILRNLLHCTFTESMDFFDTLVKMRPKEIVNILCSWTEPKSHKNLKYLASDFIGKYQLTELAEEVRRQSEPILHLGNLTVDNRGCHND